jgi:hypothetical protein
MFTGALEMARILTDRIKGTLGYVPRGLAQGMLHFWDWRAYEGIER